MRFIGRLEHSFVADLISTTRQLLKSGKTHNEKVCELYEIANVHFQRAEKLKAKQESLLIRPRRTAKIKAIVSLREKAGCYLWATAKYVKANSADDLSLQGIPSILNPQWLEELEAKYEVQKEPVHFMEFSS